jgi:thioredoxin reductase
MDEMNIEHKTVAIIGGGPVGLAAAAHALQRGLTPIVLEAGLAVGHAVRQWGHVRMFSPWEYNIDQAARRLLENTGWNSPDPNRYPTGADLVEQYLEPLTDRTALKDHIKVSSRVNSVSRVGFDKVKTKGREQAQFELRYANGAGPSVLRADAVIDVSGAWEFPNEAGANGLAAIGQETARHRIAYAMPDVLGGERARYGGRTVAVIGSGHSAVGTLIDLVELKQIAPRTHVIWVMRGERPEKAFGGGANDKLVERGALGRTLARLVAQHQIQMEVGFATSHIELKDGRVRIATGLSSCGSRQVMADEVIVATGFRPDLSFLRELRVALDPALECPLALAPLIDPNEHSCGTVRPHGARELSQPEPGFYFAGMKSYGRAPTFLMLTGYEQVRSIVADIAGDHAAADRVELVLPETGVCSLAPVADTSAGCCGGPALHDSAACCVADEKAKQSGASGCGCN